MHAFIVASCTVSLWARVCSGLARIFGYLRSMQLVRSQSRSSASRNLHLFHRLRTALPQMPAQTSVLARRVPLAVGAPHYPSCSCIAVRWRAYSKRRDRRNPRGLRVTVRRDAVNEVVRLATLQNGPFSLSMGTRRAPFAGPYAAPIRARLGPGNLTAGTAYQKSVGICSSFIGAERQS
jgi:hypothetical protein